MENDIAEFVKRMAEQGLDDRDIASLLHSPQALVSLGFLPQIVHLVGTIRHLATERVPA